MRLNAFSYYVDFAISAALVALLAGTTFATGNAMQAAQWLLVVCLGFAGWTLIEYFVHRVIYHNVPYFRDLHAAHHAEPAAHIGAPPIIGIVLILMVFFTPIVTTSFIVASGLTTGMLAGYMTYMLVHHAAHHWRLPPTFWLTRIGRHHALHHHHSEQCNFGITTSIWDRMLGTAFERRGATSHPSGARSEVTP